MNPMRSLREHRWHIALLVAVFMIFLAGAAGVLEVSLIGGPDVNLNLRVLSELWRMGEPSALMRGADFAGYVAIGLLLAFVLPLLSPINGSALVLAAMSLPLYLAYSLPGLAPAVPMEYALLTILMLFVANLLADYYHLTRARQRLIRIFGQYIPPTVVEAMVTQPESFSLEGEARELSVMFCDIKNFSSISEQLDPRQLAKLLNTYFTAMTDILHHHGATIDKYIGDAIMAFWGAPVPQPDHARRALSAAMEMQQALVGLRARFVDKGWPPIDMGIGISTGIMNVGNMGSRYRVAYTVVGDVVNIGSRIESLTRVYDTDIIVSEATKAAIPDVLFCELDCVRVKGKGEATRIFEVVCALADARPEDHERVALHETALAAYYARDWAGARAGFEKLRARGGRERYCALFLERIAAHEHNTPAADWDGVNNLHEHGMRY